MLCLIPLRPADEGVEGAGVEVVAMAAVRVGKPDFVRQMASALSGTADRANSCNILSLLKRFM